MSEDDLNFNDNQKALLGFAAITFFMFIIMSDDDNSMLCCCTTILLLIAIPIAATTNSNNTSTYAPIEPSSLFSNELNKDIEQSKKRKPTNPKDIPLEWKQLKEIYPEAEIDEYLDHSKLKGGKWDLKGLKEDLKLMMKRTGKKPSKRESESKRTSEKLDFESMKYTEFKKLILAMNNTKLRKILKNRGLPVTGVKSRLIARLMDSVKYQKKKVGSFDDETKYTITKKKITKSKEEEKTMTIECPYCASRMEIPDVPGMQEVQCSECGIKGEIEL